MLLKAIVQKQGLLESHTPAGWGGPSFSSLLGGGGGCQRALALSSWGSPPALSFSHKDTVVGLKTHSQVRTDLQMLGKRTPRIFVKDTVQLAASPSEKEVFLGLELELYSVSIIIFLSLTEGHGILLLVLCHVI